MILELCEEASESKTDSELKYDKNLNPFENYNEDGAKTSLKTKFGLGIAKKFMRQSSKKQNELYLKISTSKMRCSMKVKEEFENVSGRNE